MKIMVIGDVHIGKKFNSYKVNQYSKVQTNLRNYWLQSTLSYIRNVTSKVSDIDMIVFLGDIYDSPSMRPELINSFRNLLGYIKQVNKNTEIHIIIGNHDTTEPQSSNATLLSLFENKNIYVHFNYSVINNNLLMLPYYKKDKLTDTLAEIVSKYGDNFSPVIFSHNDFYVNDTLFTNEMISVDNVKLLFGANTVIVNGHIHNYHYEPNNGVLFTGSVSPTSFKDSPVASGICYFEYDVDNKQVQKFRAFKNNRIVFITIDNELYIDKLKEYLNKCSEIGCKVVLRFYPKIKKQIENVLIQYSETIIAYKEHIEDESNNDNNLTNELTKLQEHIKQAITNNTYTIHELNETFNSYIKKKYGFSPNEV